MSNFLFKKAYLCTEPFTYLAYLIQTKNKKFFEVTEDTKGNIEVYKFKEGTLDIEYAVWGQNFKTTYQAFEFLRKEVK